MDTGTGGTPDYIGSSLSTVAREEESKGIGPIYEGGPSTGDAESVTSKPTRITFKVQRVKIAGV